MNIIWITVAVLIAGGIIFFFIRKHLKKMEDNKGIQESTIDFIKQEEGVVNRVYKDPIGKDTVGVGHLVLPKDNLPLGTKVTNETIDNLLKSDLQISNNTITRTVKVKLNQNQFDALISLIFNIGSGQFQTSTLLKSINAGKSKEDIATAWMSWKNAGGKPILSARREREINLYFS